MEFNSVYDSLTKNYQEIEGVLFIIFDKIQVATDELTIAQNVILFAQVAEAAKGILKTQTEFTINYAPADLKEQLLDRLQEKENSLTEAVNKAFETGRKIK